MRRQLSVMIPLLLAALSAAAVEPPVRPEPMRIPKPASPHVISRAALGQVAGSVAVPQGSYLQSCQHMAVNAGVLSADCDTGRDGRYHASSIDVARCGTSDIFNRWGTLMCSTPVRANWGGSVLPPGSYLASCAGHVDGMVLHAACGTGATEQGDIPFLMSHEGVAGASLDLSRCPDGSEIANMHGELVCIAR